MVHEKQVASQIADETTLNRKEAEMALAQLEKVLIRELLAGNSVQLDDWSSFNLTCNSASHDQREQVTAAPQRTLHARTGTQKRPQERTVRPGRKHGNPGDMNPMKRRLDVANATTCSPHCREQVAGKTPTSHRCQ